MTAPTKPPATYQEALTAAAAIVAQRAAASDPAAVMESMSEQIASVRDTTAAWAKNAIRGLWAAVDPYSDAQVQAFAVQAARLMESAQTAAARVAAAGQSQQLSALGVAVTGIPSNPVDVRAPNVVVKAGQLVLRHGAAAVDYQGGAARVSKAEMTTKGVFGRPAAVFRYATSQGSKDAAQLAVQRIDALVDDNLMLAQRLAQQQVIVQAVTDLDTGRTRSGTKIIGYRRIIHPELSRTGTCGMCIVASDRIYHIGELMPIHAHCHCTIGAITEDYDPADDLNAVDLGQLYKEAGGTGSALLKRTRYKVDEHGELGPVLVPRKAYKPRSAKSKVRASALAPGQQESKADIAARHLPLLEQNLANLREMGHAEDSPQVTYHKVQIARMKSDAGEKHTARPPAGDDGGVNPPPPTGPPRGASGGDEPPDSGDHPELSPEDHAAAREAARSKRERAAAAEPAVSDVLASAVTTNGGQLERFDSRLKSVDSLYRKVQDLMVESDVEAAIASEWIRDSLRYTVLVDESGYWAAGTGIGEALVQAGYQRAKVVTGWNREGYRGRNDTFIGPDGLEFEVQIHTAASLDAAEKTHPLYEEERLPTTPDGRKAQLRAMQYEIFDAVPAPDDIVWID